jgi:hypothetical protein
MQALRSEHALHRDGVSHDGTGQCDFDSDGEVNAEEQHLSQSETNERRAAYRESYEAQRRAARDPQFMATLSQRIADLNEKYARTDQ